MSWQIRWAVTVFAILILAALAGCQNGGKGHKNEGGAQPSANLTVGGKLSALLTQTSAAAPSSIVPMFTASDVVTGTLSVTNTATSATQTFTWNAYLDSTTLDVQSNKTVAVFPGTYDLRLLLTIGSQQYAGEVLGQVLNDGTNSVSMTIRPIIGNTISDVSVVARLADFRFHYDPAELSAFASPQLGIAIDSGPESVFTINPLTGLSDAYVNLPQGMHLLHLNFYNGSLLVGRSIPEQESVNVQPGMPIAMDLVTLHAETVLVLNESTGSAAFSFTLPAEIVDEAGGLSNLSTTFQVSGPQNPYQETALSLSPAGGNYEAAVTLSGFQFGDVSMALVFNDIGSAPNEYLGGCTVTGVTLDSNGRTVACAVTLRRRSVVSGNLLATVALNVWNTAGEPVAGATVLANGNPVGITGSGAFGTPGYLKFYLVSGNYTLRASDATYYGEIPISPQPLGLVNSDITLASPIYVDADGDGYLSDVDCNDAHPWVHPGAPGTGEGIDNNCDGVIAGDEITVGSVTISGAGGFVADHHIRNIDGDVDGVADDLRISRIRFHVSTAGTFFFDSLVWEATGVDLNGDGQLTGFDNYMVLIDSAGSVLAANDDSSATYGDGSVHSYDSTLNVVLSVGTYTLTVGQLSYSGSQAMAGYYPNRAFYDYTGTGHTYGAWRVTTTASSGGVIDSAAILADGAAF